MHSARPAPARDRAAAEIPPAVAPAAPDALFLCGLAHSAPGPLTQVSLGTRARANPPGVLPPSTDPIAELPSAALLRRRRARRAAADEHVRLVVVRPEVPESLPWDDPRHLPPTAGHLERALGDRAHAVPPGRLMAPLDGDDPESPDRLDRLCRAPVDPPDGPDGMPGGAPRSPRSSVRLAAAPGGTGR